MQRLARSEAIAPGTEERRRSETGAAQIVCLPGGIGRRRAETRRRRTAPEIGLAAPQSLVDQESVHAEEICRCFDMKTWNCKTKHRIRDGYTLLSIAAHQTLTTAAVTGEEAPSSLNGGYVYDQMYGVRLILSHPCHPVRYALRYRIFRPTSSDQHRVDSPYSRWFGFQAAATRQLIPELPQSIN